MQISTSQYVPSMQLWSCSSCVSRHPLQLYERSSARWISCKRLWNSGLQGSHVGCRGNILVTGSTTSLVIGLTWGGVQYSWSSARVLSSLIFGLLGLCVFVIYEIYFCKPPVVSPFAGTRQVSSTGFNIPFKVPIVLRMSWTGASGYIQNFLMAVVLATLSCT